MPDGEISAAPEQPPPRLATIAREWTRIGLTGFGGPPTHIALLRRLCVNERRWLSSEEFEDGIAAVNMLPGPASTQLTIFCAWRLGGPVGALLGGTCFIFPGLVAITVLSALFLSAHPPAAVAGAAAGAGAAVPAVALSAAFSLAPAAWRRAAAAARPRAAHVRWVAYAVVGSAAGATPSVAPFVVVALAACGAFEVLAEGRARRLGGGSSATVAPGVLALAPVFRLMPSLAALSGSAELGPLVWIAFKVGALSFGGGFVIIPLMQHDVVSTYHFMSRAHFLDAVALGQVTPGPVVLTVSAVGYAAAGVAGAAIGAVVGFTPSFLFVIVGGRHFRRLRGNETAQRVLTGAGAAAIGSIAGASVPLGLALVHLWQFGVLAAAAVWLLVLRRGIVVALLGAGVVGAVAVLAGAPI